MPPGENQVRLGPQAPDAGEGGADRVDQLAGQRAVVVGQTAAEHFGQSEDRLAQAVAGPFRVQPAPPVTQEVMEPASGAVGILEEAEVLRHAGEHSLPRMPAPKAGAEA